MIDVYDLEKMKSNSILKNNPLNKFYYNNINNYIKWFHFFLLLNNFFNKLLKRLKYL